jgi:hypothetical protein
MAPGYQDSTGDTNITHNASLLCHNPKPGARLLLTNGTTEINEVTYQMRHQMLAENTAPLLFMSTKTFKTFGL